MSKKRDALYTPSGLETTLLERYNRWIMLYNNGCSDPFWPDGVNLNLCRNHIIYQKMVCEDKLGDKFGLYPDSYFYPLPDEVSRNFMVKDRRLNSQGTFTPVYPSKPCSEMFHFDWGEVLNEVQTD